MRVLTKSGLIIVLAVAAFATGALVARIYTIAPEYSQIETHIKSLLSDAGDSVAEMRSEKRFQFFPPEFVLSRPDITTARGSQFRAQEIRIGFGLTSLLTGKFHPSTLEIFDSEFIIAAPSSDADRLTAETILVALVDLFGNSVTDRQLDHITSIRFNSNKVKISGSDRARDLQIESATLDRSGRGALSFAGTVITEQRKIELELDVGAVTQNAIQERATRFSMKWEGFKISGSGETTFGTELQFLGSLSMDAQSLGAVSSVFRVRSDLTEGMSAKLETQARLSFSTLTLSDMRLQAGDATINGNMVADIAAPIPRVTGTFATSQLDLSGVTDRLGLTRRALNETNTRKWPDRIVPDIDLDLRLSSERVTIHEAAIDNVALSIIVRDHKAELTVATANLFEGSISGKFRIDAHDIEGPYRISASLGMEAIDLEKAGLAFFDSRRVTGIAAGQLDMTAMGRSSREALATLNGALNLAIDNTTVSGIDLLAFLQRVEARPVGAVLGFRNGTTQFEAGHIALQIENGVATLGQARFTQFPQLQVRLDGVINLVESRLDLKGHATASSAQSAQRSIDLPFALQGEFDDPAFIPDFTNASKQSGPITP